MVHGLGLMVYGSFFMLNGLGLMAQGFGIWVRVEFRACSPGMKVIERSRDCIVGF